MLPQDRAAQPADQDGPFVAPVDVQELVTVIMPVRNEEAYIERSLGAVLGQSYGLERLQILVVDGRSQDRTRELARELGDRRGADLHGSDLHGSDLHGSDLQIVDNPGLTAPCAMNAGLRRARGAYIVRVDGHCEVGPHYVENAVRRLAARAADGVGGPLETIGETKTARAISAAMSSTFGVGGVAFRTAGPGGAGREVPDREVDTVAFPAYRRDVVARAGAFDEQLMRNQDDEYNYRLRGLGYRLVLAGDMPARYYSRGTYRSLARQYFQYGVYKVRVLQKHPRQMRPRQFVPAAFVLALFGAALLSAMWSTLGPGAIAGPWSIAGPWPMLAVVLPYLAANLAAAVLTARRHGWDLLPRLPPAFALLHLGYGLGFFVGLVRFARRWGDKEGQTPDLGWSSEPESRA